MSSDLPLTEQRNLASTALDSMSSLEIVRLMNSEDARVPAAVAREAESIARAIDVIADRLRVGGRLVYIGAGTSGRLGVLDASECPPTFNSPPEQVIGIIAGGNAALTRAIEGAEDRAEQADVDLAATGLSHNDVLVGIATSGRTPYVMRGLEYARSIGTFTVGLSCTGNSAIADAAELAITPEVGPEILTGSTRLKAGTATKLVLNMLTTGAMVRLGKTYGNLMVDLRATNSKLRARTTRIVRELTGLSEQEAKDLLQRADGELKTAVIVHHRGVSPEEARSILAAAGGQLRAAIQPPPEHGESSAMDLLLGIDGGGTGTLALLAQRGPSGALMLIGRGEAGPSNPQAVGFASAFEAIESAIHQAFSSAGVQPVVVGAACMALAGASRQDDQQQLDAWARRSRLAAQFRQVHDAEPVLAAASPSGPGIALIAGTGSLAYGRDAAGRTARSGGWGYLFGDEGSAYALALEGIRAVVKARDGRGSETGLQDRVLSHLKLDAVEQLVSAVYQRMDRPGIAALAECVTAAAAEGDAVAVGLIERAAADLADMVAAVAKQLDLTDNSYTLGLAGGLMVGCSMLRDGIKEALRARQLSPVEVRIVEEPAVGSLHLAAELLASQPTAT